MVPRFLACGWTLHHPEIQQEDFFEGLSFSAVEAVFVDPGSISERWVYDVPLEKDGTRRTYPATDHGFGRTLSRLMVKRRNEAADLLDERGGILICRLRPRGEPLEVITQGGPGERIDRYSWLPTVSLVDRQHQLTFPANSRFLSRRGEDIVLGKTGSPFEEYLHEFDGKIMYCAVYQDLLSTPIDRFATVLARNKVGDIVALEIPFGEGRLVLLPPIEGAPPAKEAASLLKAVNAEILRPAFFAEPDWFSAYALAGEDGLRDELASLSERRTKLDEKLKEIACRLEEATKYKRILYTKGRFTLLPAVGETFRTLGFDVDASNDYLFLRSDEGDAIAVVAATEQATIDLSPYRRLLDRVDRARTEGEGAGKGILVASGSRELDPKRRPTQFSPEVLRGCQSQGFCLLTTYELFKLVQQALEESDAKALAGLRRGLLECDGEYRGVR